MISSNVLKRNVKEMSNEMAQQDFPRIQSEIKLGAPATTDEFEITEGRGAKKWAPATLEIPAEPPAEPPAFFED